MNRRRIFFVFAICISLICIAGETAGKTGKKRSGQICITFDNLPAERIYDKKDRNWIDDRILTALKKHNIKAAGFVIGDNIEGDWSILEKWLGAGHIIGFLPYSGQDVNEVPTGYLVDDIDKGMESLEDITSTHQQSGRYFRYPLLRYGKNPEIRKQIEDFLTHENVTVVHATVVPNDFIFNLTADKLATSRDSTRIKELCNEYISHIQLCLDSAEVLASDVMGRKVKHIMELHANRINAMFLDEIMASLIDRGYRIISLPDALQDKLYKYHDAYYADQTVSFLKRIKLSDPNLLPAIEEY